jgi:hypothetical protein
MRLILISAFFITSLFAFSQEATIVLRDSVKLKAELVLVAENQLHTKVGTIGLSEIYSVSFSSITDVLTNSKLIGQMQKGGVLVYAAGKKVETVSMEDSVTTMPISTTKPQKEQSNEKAKEDHGTFAGSFGLGFGQDYGGIGGRLTISDQHVGLFASVGYIFVGTGYNFGANLRFQPEKKTVPTLSIMYGYNAAIKVSGAPQFDKVYNGVSIGGGFISKGLSNPKNYWHFELILPFRSGEFDADFDALRSNPFITGLEKPWPITISVGYHFSF